MNKAQLTVNKLGYKIRKLPAKEEDLPLPPPNLIEAVAGTDDPKWFIDSGAFSVQCITETMEKNGLDLHYFHRILDFGCGVGRVLRHWNSWHGLELYGSDYNKELIIWCKKNLKHCKFKVNALRPGLSWSDGTFDFIYAISVFTHLTEELQGVWMHELHRLLRAGGFLLFTTHGEHYLDQLSEDEKGHFSTGQLVVRYPERVGTNDCGVFHPAKYVHNQLASEFSVVDFIPSGFRGAPYQDIWLFQSK